MVSKDDKKTPPEIERALKSLVTVDKAVGLYPRTSTIPRDNANVCANIFGQILKEYPEVRFVVTKDGLLFDGAPVFPNQPAYSNFAMTFYNHRLADVRFHVGVDARSIIGFLSVLQTPPEDLVMAGGFEARMWDLNIGNITVTEVHVSIVDAADEEAMPDMSGMSPNDIDDIITAAYGGMPREQLTVTRFLTDPSVVSSYLGRVCRLADGTVDLQGLGERFSQLAGIAYEVGSAEGRMDALRSLGASLGELDPELRHSLLVKEVFPEARTNEALAALIRQLDLEEVCRLLVSDVAADDISRDGLARALRNLSMISISDSDDVLSAAGAAMRGAGLDEGFVSGVIETTLPSRVTVRQSRQDADADTEPVEAILKLMDLAPLPEASLLTDDPDVKALQKEAKRGITDGDVIMALVSLVSLDPREAQFATTMSMLEDSLGLLIERGDIDIAADVADVLMLSARDEALTQGQRARLRGAISRFTRPTDVNAIAHALRLYPAGSPEHEAARRLLEILGPLAVDPLLEQLASEEDMAARKLVIDLLNSMALKYISELGRHVTDSRWFVVRNVVSILGTTHTSAILPYIEKVVRHPEPRVRREVIRALSTIHDRLAHQLLVSALSDDDAQNVQLAARFIGAAGITMGVPALIQVAKGEGRGNRDVGPRVEALEALGRLGAREALPALEGLARGRSIMSGRGREVRTAAEAAIAQIAAGGAQ